MAARLGLSHDCVHAGLSPDDRKAWSLERARLLWPDHEDLFRLKKHNGRAEAALIGYVLHEERLTKRSAA